MASSPIRLCSRCGESKEAGCFNKNKRTKDGLSEYCKACRHEYENAWRMQPSKVAQRIVNRSTPEAKHKAFAYSLRSNYNLTVADYESIFRSQGGACAICERPPKTKRLGVDHCHKTGLIRGLLCAHCNVALGKFRDDNELIMRASAYVTHPPASTALGGQRFGLRGRINNKAATRRRLNPERYGKDAA